MAELLHRDALLEQADIHAQIPAMRAPAQVNRTFELPAVLYATTVACFLGFIGVMALGFGNPGLAIPLAICALFVVAGFGVPMIWTRLAPDAGVKAKSWARFADEGVMTGSGRASARDAAVQVLILPVLIFLWGVCSVVIAALV